MIQQHQKDYWRKLDNTAKLFSLDGKNNTNIFRYSVILKENIDENILRNALKRTLNKYKHFKVKLKTGVFWNYIQYNSKEPLVNKENKILFERINYTSNNDYLFKVTYYNNKINLDVFHILTDGLGAIEFLKSIICDYIDLKKEYPITKIYNKITDCDQYLINCNKKTKECFKTNNVYIFPEKTNKNTNNTYHYIIDIDEMKKLCKSYNVTITEYLTSMYIYSIYVYSRKTNKKIIVSIPIDLRKYYNVYTLSNFFSYMNVELNIIENEFICFNDILNSVKKQFKEKLTQNKVKEYLARDVKLGNNIFIRLIPLFIKKLFMKCFSSLVTRISTSTLSNVGSIDVESKYKEYIDNILVMVIPGKVQKIKCSICSFDKYLNVTLNSNIDDTKFQKIYLSLLKKQIKNIKIETNIK